MSVKVIFPSAGHNLKDPGAVYNGRKEADEMISIRNMIVLLLGEANHANIPDNDTESASQHQARIKTGAGSVVCEFHLNAAANQKATGTEAVVKLNATENSKAMAKELTDATARILGIRNRGVITEAQTARKKIGIVNKPGTAVLLEICFLSNPDDMKAYDAHKPELAKTYAEILIKYDNLL